MKTASTAKPERSAWRAQHSDAFVFFGATGDLAYKQIFPALQALVRRGQLEAPIVGVGRSGWTRRQLIERARASIKEHAQLDEQAFGKLAALMRYVDGDYSDAGYLYQTAPGARQRACPAALSGHSAERVRDRDRRAGRMPRVPTMRAWCWRNRSAAI